MRRTAQRSNCCKSAMNTTTRPRKHKVAGPRQPTTSDQRFCLCSECWIKHKDKYLSEIPRLPTRTCHRHWVEYPTNFAAPRVGWLPPEKTNWSRARLRKFFNGKCPWSLTLRQQAQIVILAQTRCPVTSVAPSVQGTTCRHVCKSVGVLCPAHAASLQHCSAHTHACCISALHSHAS